MFWLVFICFLGRFLKLGIGDFYFFFCRFWRGCFRGVLASSRFAGVAWIFFSLASMCFVGRSGDFNLFLLLFG